MILRNNKNVSKSNKEGQMRGSLKLANTYPSDTKYYGWGNLPYIMFEIMLISQL